MATKWKNTIENARNTRAKILAFFKKILEILKTQNGRAAVLGCLCLILAVFPFCNIVSSYFSWYDWWVCVLCGLLLGLGCGLLIQLRMDLTYHKLIEIPGGSYEDWKKTERRQHRKLLLIFLALPALLCAFLLFGTYNYYSFWGYFFYKWSMENVIALFFIVVIVFLFCASAVHFCTGKQLDALVERDRAANQALLDAALTAERESVAAAMAAQKESVAAAIRSEKLKVDLISNVSHDLKTPLTSMVGYIDLLKKEELSDTCADYVEVLSGKAQKLKEMIESLFSLAKTSSGNIELNPQPLNLNRLLEQICADMDDKIADSGLEFVTELTAEDAELVTDSGYLYRICQNLVENALKYSALHTRVFLKTISTATETGNTLRFEITNTAGYRMNFTKEQIVERFARGDESRTTEGNGLGLAIVNTYTAALGGSFDVRIDCDQFKAVVTFDRLSTKRPNAS